MVVGMPNVGKSSLINLLRGKANSRGRGAGRGGGGGGGVEGAKQVLKVLRGVVGDEARYSCGCCGVFVVYRTFWWCSEHFAVPDNPPVAAFACTHVHTQTTNIYHMPAHNILD